MCNQGRYVESTYEQLYDLFRGNAFFFVLKLELSESVLDSFAITHFHSSVMQALRQRTVAETNTRRLVERPPWNLVEVVEDEHYVQAPQRFDIG